MIGENGDMRRRGKIDAAHATVIRADQLFRAKCSKRCTSVRSRWAATGLKPLVAYCRQPRAPGTSTKKSPERMQKSDSRRLPTVKNLAACISLKPSMGMPTLSLTTCCRRFKRYLAKVLQKHTAGRWWAGTMDTLGCRVMRLQRAPAS